MTVLPGSLDNLYYNGILDHIPYEAYEYGVANPYGGMVNPYSGLKQSVVGYNNMSNGGLIYDTYNTRDTFVRNGKSHFSSPTGRDYAISGNSYDAHGLGRNYNVANEQRGNEERSFIDSIRNAGAKTKESVLNLSSSSIWKGLAAAALVIATPILIIKGWRRPSAKAVKAAEAIDKPSFWSSVKDWFSNIGTKLNPKNWFKK